MSNTTRLSRIARIGAVCLLLVSMFGAVGVGAQTGIQTETADLAVEQPDYIGQSVGTDTANGTTVHVVHAQQVELQPQNFGDGEVVSFGVETGVGSLTYDDRMDVYEFDAEDETGTFELYWEVEHDRVVEQNDSTTTQTVRTRYTALLRVASNDSYAHVPSGDLEQQQENAANWQEWTGELERMFGDDVDTELRTQQAIDLLNLRTNPLAALSGNFTGILFAMVATLGGLLVLALFAVYHLGIRLSDLRYINRTESRRAGEQEIGERLNELEDEKRKRVLQNLDWNDILEDDASARAFRDVMGETVYDGSSRLAEILDPEKLVYDRLVAMHSEGWVGVEEGDEIGLAKSADVDADAETYDLAEPDEEVLGRLDWQNADLRSFDLREADIDAEDGAEFEGLDLEELRVKLEANGQDFTDTEEWGQYLNEFVEHVRQSPYTDEHGTPETTRMVLNNWLQVSQMLSDRHESPFYTLASDAIQRALLDLDPVEDAESIVDDIEAGVGA